MKIASTRKPVFAVSDENRFRHLVRTAIAAGAAIGAAPGTLFAQTTPPPAAAPAAGGETELETLEITGSRLPSLNVTSTAPLTLVGEEEIKFQGTINIETLINSMPQSFAEFSTGDSNGATGTATISLRGLGSSRTLILIDGKRLMPGDPLLSPSAPNLNFIPAPLVEEIQILSGGASAVYGSDAIAGVVNFIMKKDYEGFQIGSQFGQTTHNDSAQRQYHAMWGTNFAGGSGNVTLYAGLTTLDQLTQDQRSFSSCSITTPGAGTTHRCAGSRTIAEGLVYSYYAASAGYHLIDPAGTRNFVPDDGRTFNFAPYNYFQRPTERHTLGGFAHREISEHLGFYGSAMFMDDRTIAAVAPSGLFFIDVDMPCDNPFMSAAQQAELCVGQAGTPATVPILFAKRTVELGPREADLRHTDFRINVGANGDIIPGLHYDVSIQRGEDIYAASNNGYVNTTNAREGVAVTDDGLGNPVCASGNPDCVPVDFFQLGALTPAMASFIGATGFTQARMRQNITNGTLTFDLGQWGAKIPSADSGIGIALGVEHRSEYLAYRPDTLVAGGLLGGGGGPSPAIEGEFFVDEMFGEFQLPIVEHAPGAELLSLDAAYRMSDYSTAAGNVDSSKIGMQYAPLQQATLRVSYQQATRAPQITELFSPQALGLFSGSDPCAGKNLFGNANAPTQAQCANSGVTPAQYTAGVNNTPGQIPECISGQCNGLFGGNPLLQSEESTTMSYGLVIQPTKDITITLDYFDIQIEEVISTAPAQQTISSCINSGDPAACARIHRGGSGQLWGEPTNPNVGWVDAINENLAEYNTSGVDMEVDAKVGMADAGRLRFNYVATYLLNIEFPFDCTGLYGVTCGTPSPEYRHKFRTTWYGPAGLTLTGQWRFIQGTELDKNTSDPNLKLGTFNTIDAELEDKHYLDLAATYALPFTGGFSKALTLRAGVNNVLDEEPQAVSSNAPNSISGPPFGNGNTFPNVYDVFGPSYFLGLTADF